MRFFIFPFLLDGKNCLDLAIGLFYIQFAMEEEGHLKVFQVAMLRCNLEMSEQRF